MSAFRAQDGGSIRFNGPYRIPCWQTILAGTENCVSISGGDAKRQRRQRGGVRRERRGGSDLPSLFVFLLRRFPQNVPRGRKKKQQHETGKAVKRRGIRYNSRGWDFWIAGAFFSFVCSVEQDRSRRIAAAVLLASKSQSISQSINPSINQSISQPLSIYSHPEASI